IAKLSVYTSIGAFVRSFMFCNRHAHSRTKVFRSSSILLFGLILAVFLGQSSLVLAQGQPSSSSSGQKQEPPPEAGGPNDVGPYAIPQKKNEPPPPPPVEKPKKVEGLPDYSIRVDVPLVNVDVAVTTKDGQFVNGLKKDNFKIYEDGTQQTISN